MASFIWDQLSKAPGARTVLQLPGLRETWEHGHLPTQKYCLRPFRYEDRIWDNHTQQMYENPLDPDTITRPYVSGNPHSTRTSPYVTQQHTSLFRGKDFLASQPPAKQPVFEPRRQKNGWTNFLQAQYVPIDPRYDFWGRLISEPFAGPDAASGLWGQPDPDDRGW